MTFMYVGMFTHKKMYTLQQYKKYLKIFLRLFYYINVYIQSFKFYFSDCGL